MIATLNDLEIKSGDITIAYVEDLITEKVCAILGPEMPERLQ